MKNRSHTVVRWDGQNDCSLPFATVVLPNHLEHFTRDLECHFYSTRACFKLSMHHCSLKDLPTGPRAFAWPYIKLMYFVARIHSFCQDAVLRNVTWLQNAWIYALRLLLETKSLISFYLGERDDFVEKGSCVLLLRLSGVSSLVASLCSSSVSSNSWYSASSLIKMVV